MVELTIYLRDAPSIALDELSRLTGISKTELIEVAIKQFLIGEILFLNQLQKECYENKISKFFEYCIYCDKKLDTYSKKNHHYHKSIEIFELKFCCTCYEKFKDIPFNKLPAHIIKKIQGKLTAYKKIIICKK
jgi:hypothetical protein